MTRFPKLSLQELCEKITDGTHHSPPNGPSGDFMYVTAKNIRPWGLDLEDISYVDAETHSEIYARCDVRKGDVLYVKDGAGTGTVAVNELEEPFSLLSSVGVLRPGPALLPKYLFYALQEPTTKQSMLDNVAGVAITRLTLKKLNAAEIPVAPLAEQARIVAKLEELLSDLDAGVAELKVAQKKLQQYRQSLLKAAVEGALTADWREAQRQQGAPTETGAQLLARILTERRARWEAKQLAKFKEQGKAPPKDWQKKYPEPVSPDTSDLPMLPEGWVWASVEQLGEVQLGRQRSPDKLKGIAPTPYIRAANITEAGIDFSDVLEMDFSEQERNTFRLHAGDVLLTEASGSAEHVGRPAVWPKIDGLYCFQNTVLRFHPQGIGTDFAFYSFLAMQKLGVFRKLSGGVGINHLSAGKFSTLAFALPPRGEQVEIVQALESKLAAIDERGREIERSIKHSTAQRQNILRAAFAGELVPQDSRDEPASVLLQRIGAERFERTKRPKIHRTKQGKEIATLVNKLIDVLTEAGDWMPAQEAFRRCGVGDGALTERIEELYAELRNLDKAGRLEVEAVTDAQGRKMYDKIKLRVS